ncbi:MAG: hypothetical protein U0271_47765 [Polyangiaceae bacterium]
MRHLTVITMLNLLVSVACGGNDPERCVPGEQVSCACPNDTNGVQACNEEGTGFDACTCADPPVGGSGGIGAAGGSSDGGAGHSSGGAGGNAALGGAGEGGAGGAPNPCEGQPVFAGLVPDVASIWGSHPSANGKEGYDAGVEICKTIGADHPCDYVEVLQGESAGELLNVATGTSVWIHRTTDVTVNNVNSPAGSGGRCVDWVFNGNHIADGEYAVFPATGVLEMHLDADTFYDGVDTTHANPGDLPCGGVTRSLACCFAACVP